MSEIKKHFSRWKEFICVLFGHDWYEYGNEQNADTRQILHEYNVCAYCGLEKHDRSGYTKVMGKQKEVEK